MQIGAQLYTVRDYTKSLEDFSSTLEKIAEIGYKVVQVSGTCDYKPEWLKEQLQRFGLTCALTHINPTRLAEETDAVVAEHSIFGCSNIGLGSMPRPLKDNKKDYDVFLKTFKPVAKRFKELGCHFMYHNHNFEFARIGDGKVNYLDQIAADFSADELSFILDTYWVQAAGGDPVEWIKKFSGRLQCVHLKDMEYHNDGIRMAPIYEGNMNFDAIIEACACAGTETVFVEQDNCNGENPFDCLTRSFNNLKSKGL